MKWQIKRWFSHAPLLCALCMGCNGCDKGRPTAKPTANPIDPEVTQTSRETPKKLVVPPGKPVTFDEALARVERVRGLTKKTKVDGLLIEKKELSAHLRRALAFERPDEVLLGTEVMMVGLGVVERGFDFEATMVSLLEENLAGLYEPRLELMMVREDLPEETKRITLLHELVHALQDQYFDLDEVVVANPDDTDKSSALSCLAEGDATSAMLDGVLPAGKTALDLPEGTVEAQFFAQAPQTKAPNLIIRSLYAPYLDGLTFVHQLRRRGGFAEVDRAFTRPPITTEQILHLDKYDQQEAPLSVAVPPPPGPGYESILHDIWGEQSLRLVLEEWMPMDRAALAAGGWGGDRIVAYRNGEQLAVAWDIAMDDEKEALELWRMLTADEAAATDVACAKGGPADAPGAAVGRRNNHIVFASAPFRRATGLAPCAEAQGWLRTLLVKITP